MTSARPSIREEEVFALLREAQRRLEDLGMDPARGRYGSLQGEEIAVGMLATAIREVAAEQGLLVECIVSPERGWCELEVLLRRNPDDVPFRAPINVKITAGKAADNVNARIGLLWAFLGIYPGPGTSEGLLCKDQNFYAIFYRGDPIDAELVDNADYYFSVFYKDDEGVPRRGNLFSLKRLEGVQANASNPPFQVPWSREDAAAPLHGPDPAPVPWAVAARRLLGAMIESDLLAAKRASYHRASAFLPDASDALRREAADATDVLLALLSRRRSPPDAA